MDYLRSRAQAINHLACPASIDRQLENEHFYIEEVQACRHCGCTENDACETEDGPCHWVSEDVCSNPDCIAAEEAEKEVTNA